MSYLEKRIEELFAYRPELTKRPDFDAFWVRRLGEAKDAPLAATLERVEYPAKTVEVYSLAYDGVDGTRIHGLLVYPKAAAGAEGSSRLPCLVSYHGFGGSRGYVSDFAPWLLMGVAVLSIDIREQQGITGSAAPYTSGSANSVVSKGLLDKNEYYYGHVYTDCIRAVDVAVAQERIDASRIIVSGVSQGGGIATAVAALDPRPVIAMTDVPSNSNIEHRMEVKVGPYSGTGAYASVTEYLRRHPDDVEQVFETLSYFDTMNMADRIRCRVLASVGLEDIVCPPECYFATYNRITSEKEIEIYRFNGHEGGGSHHTERKIRFLAEHLPGARAGH